MMLRRAAQIALTCALFALCNSIGSWFEVGDGVSILYPAAAVSILSCMIFGWWAAIGVVLGTVLTPWSTNNELPLLLASGCTAAIQGLIPWLVFRLRKDLAPDLRDIRSFVTFLVFGTILNSTASALLGNLFVVRRSLDWRNVFVWWISDFTAALLIATPVLAFGGALLNRGNRPRTITNALQLVTTIILLGSGASFAIQMYLVNYATAATRGKIMLVSAIVDDMVFLILVFASAMLLYTISRPFAQLRGAVRAMRDGEPLDARLIDGRYLEFRSIAETLEEASRELRHREEELRLQTEKALQASKHKSEFLAKMSHELRTPLNSIIGFSDLMTEQEETMPRQKRLAFLENVASSARHLLKLINDLLDIAKVESGKMQLNFADVDLRTSIANTVASTQPLFVRKRQEVEVYTPDEPMLVRGDASRIEQILLNLLSNANKFSGEGKPVTIRGVAEETMWRIDVVDCGSGISAEDQRRIFGEFEQVAAHSAGTGLGLALARKFVEAHGGTISVESELGRGATFTVRLPRAEERRRPGG